MSVLFDPLGDFIIRGPSGHKIPELTGIELGLIEKFPIHRAVESVIAFPTDQRSAALVETSRGQLESAQLLVWGPGLLGSEVAGKFPHPGKVRLHR